MNFIIDQSSTTFSDRPPISSMVRKYFEVFLLNNLLEKKNIIIKTKWEIHLVLCFMKGGPRYKSDYLYLAKKPWLYSVDKIKRYEILIPLKLLDGVPDPYLKTIELIFEALTIFFTTNFKTIERSDMEELWKKIDINYLRTLPYPAPLAEQKYVTDMIDKNGDVVNIVHPFTMTDN